MRIERMIAKMHRRLKRFARQGALEVARDFGLVREQFVNAVPDSILRRDAQNRVEIAARKGINALAIPAKQENRCRRHDAVEFGQCLAQRFLFCGARNRMRRNLARIEHKSSHVGRVPLVA